MNNIERNNSFKAHTLDTYSKPWLWVISEGDTPKLQTSRDMAIAAIMLELSSTNYLEDDLSLTGFKEVFLTDCWLKWPVKPEADDPFLSNVLDDTGVDFENLTISPPGSHPGGNFYWIDIGYPILAPILEVKET